ncbi:MAG: hypothetical protein ACXABG_00915 [Promethearchaeota archaeon]|jgi:hypothetical protein
MSKKVKFALIAFTPLLAILIATIVFLLLNIFDLFLFALLTIIFLPYCIAYYSEYSLKGDYERDELSAYELNLIQENKNIIKTIEVIIISFSLLFGLFTAIEFDLQIAGASSSMFSLLGPPIGVDFFMSTFVFIQVQVLGKDAYLTDAEIENITIGIHKSDKIRNLISRLRLANFTRKGCYYSLFIQICLIYPSVSFTLSF